MDSILQTKKPHSLAKSSDTEETSIVPIHYKNDKQAIENYRPASLLPICNKIIECLL